MLATRAGQSLKGAPRRLAEQTRSIHIPRRLIPPSNPANIAQRTRTFITRFISQLQAPVSRSVRPSTSIRQSLSLPARVALSRPLHAPCLPRVPRVPGNVTQVGLGTARNFSSGRPIFQHIVENVPVAGRAFYEVDWDIKTREEKDLKVRRPRKADRPAEKLKAKYEPVFSKANEHEEFSHYFSAPSFSLTTTYLQIPLAPTPTARVPLSSEPSPWLLPLSALAREHASHSKHSIRVSSLFRRLDAARVWERGATCETFGDPSGLCTILRIKFEGWTEDMVKEILGDAGKDWCTIQEIRCPLEEYTSSQESLASIPCATPPESVLSMTSNDRAISFVMPTLDFSSSFVEAQAPSTSTPDSALSLSDAASDYSFPSISQSLWDVENVSDASSIDSSSLTSSTEDWSVINRPSPGWPSFSSDFVRRASDYQDRFS